MSEPIHFLLVEDDPVEARLLEEMLRRAGDLSVEIRRADCLAEALKALDAGGIDMVLLDLGLPDSNGIETFRRLRKAATFEPIIVLSGMDDESLAVQTVQEGAEDYLVKNELTQRGVLRAIRYAVERSRSAKAMRDFSLTVRAFLAITPDSVVMMDVNGTILDLNRNAARRFGHVGDALVGRRLYDILPPELAMVKKAHVDQAAASRQTVSFVVHRGSRWYEHNFFPVLVENRHVERLVLYSRDITPFKQVERDLERRVNERTEELNAANQELRDQIKERAKLEENLMETEERYRTLFEQGADAIILIDPKDGSLVEFNARACENLGYTAEEFARLKFSDLEARESEAEVKARLHTMLHGSSSFETRHRTKSGEIRDILVHSRPVTIRGQHLINAICTDITDSKLMENQLRQAIARLEEHDRAKSDFVSNVSHDLKTPLASMSYALENLQNGIVGRVSQRVRRYHNMLHEDIQRLTRTVEDILDLSRLEVGKFTIARVRVPFARLVRRTAESVRIQTETHRLRMRVAVDDGLGFVECDPHKMVRLILNVLHNAIKFTPPGGRLEVRTRQDGEWPGFLILDVIDNGVGINAQYLPRVTERYFRVGEHISGTGIGLTICREILELHGGRLDLKSPPPGEPRGTQVTIGLPRVEPLDLVVFNRDRSVLDRVTTGLRSYGYRVRPFGDEQEAWKNLEQPPAPDAVIIDMAPEEQHGMELIVRARTLPGGAFMPVLISSPSGLDETLASLVETLRLPVVKKNDDVDDIMDVLEDDLVLRRHMAAGEPKTTEVEDE